MHAVTYNHENIFIYSKTFTQRLKKFYVGLELQTIFPYSPKL